MITAWLAWLACAPAGPAPAQERGEEALVPYTVTREDPGEPGWGAAFDVALGHFADHLASMGATEVILRPTAAPGGGRMPFVVDIVYHPNQGRVPVLGGRVVTPGEGQAGLEAVLRGAGFPAEPAPALILVELLGYFKRFPQGWEHYPTNRVDRPGAGGGAMGAAPPLAGAHRRGRGAQDGARARERRRRVRRADLRGPRGPLRRRGPAALRPAGVSGPSARGGFPVNASPPAAS